MSDPENILHKINWRERQSAYIDIPRFSLEDSPSSSQLAQDQGPDSIARTLDHTSSSSSLENFEVKDEAESVDTTRFFLHPTLEAEEVKEVTEVSAAHIPAFQPTPQASVQYIPIVIHTSLPPHPFIHQNPLPPPQPPMFVPGFLLNKYAPLALPQILNDMP